MVVVCVFSWFGVLQWSENIPDLVHLVWSVAMESVTLLVVGLSLSDRSFGVISLGKKLTHICLSQLRSINEYLASAGVTKPLAVAYASGVQVGLRVPTPQLALQLVLL